jgi:antitoxin CptB
MSESRETRLKRLRLRSWRRGTREMDLILGPYADATLAALDAGALEAYEALLEEPDPDLYDWVAGSAPPPDAHAQTIGRIRAFHRLG